MAHQPRSNQGCVQPHPPHLLALSVLGTAERDMNDLVLGPIRGIHAWRGGCRRVESLTVAAAYGDTTPCPSTSLDK